MTACELYLPKSAEGEPASSAPYYYFLIPHKFHYYTNLPEHGTEHGINCGTIKGTEQKQSSKNRKKLHQSRKDVTVKQDKFNKKLMPPQETIGRQ